MEKIRGSEKLRAAWEKRTLSEESVSEIAAQLDESPAVVERATFFGGERPTSLELSLSYTGDDVPRCGNDLNTWLRWHLKHGGSPRPPKIIINGTPIIDLIRIDLSYGNFAESIDGVGLDNLDSFKRT